jgi:xanthine dehydrogenase YagS FAD-binding subunit
MFPNFAYVRPRTLEQAVEQLFAEGGRIHAGGTDLLGCLRDGVFGAERVVSLSGLEGLRGLEETAEGGLRIGALTTITEIAESGLVAGKYPGLAQGAAEVASPQLRNQGTLGGNLCQKPRCWYYRGEFDCLRKGGPKCYAVAGENQFHCILGGAGCYIVHPSDTAPILAALGAEARVAGPGGKRRLPVAELHMPPSRDPRRETVLEPGEILTEVVVPRPPSGLYTSYRKVRARRAWDFALAGVALALVFDGESVSRARVVLSGAAPVPWRSKEAEAVVQGARITPEKARKAGEAAMRNASPMSGNGYKISLFQGAIAEELLKAAESGRN